MNFADTTAVWTIAGSDSGGGAGIQADLKTMNAFGVHGCSVITALTAQNTQGVQAVEAVSPEMLRAQLKALQADLPPIAVKTGMLGNVATCRTLADFFAKHLSTVCLICDPVLKSTSGTTLLDSEALDILQKGIFPLVDVLTPNIPEAALLTGGKKQHEQMAEVLLGMGVKSVLIKGGHADGDMCRDYWTDGSKSIWLSSPRIETNATHGTGCILASALASSVAKGQTIPSAVATAKTFLNQCLKSPAHMGAGHSPMNIGSFRNDPSDRPETSDQNPSLRPARSE